MLLHTSSERKQKEVSRTVNLPEIHVNIPTFHLRNNKICQKVRSAQKSKLGATLNYKSVIIAGECQIIGERLQNKQQETACNE